ncbi:hypothetical protein BT96DRAFT_958463 [Gymnopus androsaceus JB14]|uniref:Uncharacterized protein n=1 Tax=Gymnopus androsaceus JB14 TaxID=1447944 RepID=A0A6A4HBC4_9AGAR|nr:hypothetical protein BT96DRAFT_958463 [Gymnopus androsaceus JB14]
MSDPLGQLWVCYTPCASFIVDTPEASLISCVGGGGKTSPFTEATYKDYGDSKQHPPRLLDATLNRIQSIEDAGILPDDFPAYYNACVKQRTNGVSTPFWADWPLVEPYQFLTPEPLHHWYKMYWDHDVKWAIQVKILGYRQFLEGISALKQVTGRTHRDVMHFLIFVCTLRALTDARYMGQAPCFNDITAARGLPIKNWEIPKLEFMQSIQPSIHASGPVMQWSADATEHAHITEVKEPAHAGNNRDFEVQICRELDRNSRLRRFDLTTSMKDANVDFRIDNGREATREVEDKGNQQQYLPPLS